MLAPNKLISRNQKYLHKAKCNDPTEEEIDGVNDERNLLLMNFALVKGNDIVTVWISFSQLQG